MPTTRKAETMLQFMMFNLANEIKGTYRDAIIITRGLHAGKTILSLTTGVIDRILEFVGISPGNIELNHIIPTKSEAMEEPQQPSVIAGAIGKHDLLSPGHSIQSKS